MTILLAEDEPAIRRATKRALEGKGYTVLLAEDGEQALALFREHRSEIELVISDVEMPKLGGAQLAAALRAEADDVRLLIMSGRSPAEMAASGAFPEGVGFLQKPWTLDDLYGRIHDAMSEA